MSELSYHTWFKFAPDDCDLAKIKYFQSAFRYVGCFDSYWSAFSQNSLSINPRFYFGWTCMPFFIDELVKSFNKTFKNIKVKIVDSEDKYYMIADNTRIFAVDPNEENKANSKAVIFTVDLDKKYEGCSIRYVWYLIHQYFRHLSFAEEGWRYSGNGSQNIITESKERDFCTLVSDINKMWLDGGYTYRGIEYPFPPEHMLLVDDPDLCNKVYKTFNCNVKKQTDVQFNLYYNSDGFKKFTSMSYINKLLDSAGLKKDCLVFDTNNTTELGKVKGVISGDNSTTDGYSEQRRLYCNQVNYSISIIIEYPSTVNTVNIREAYPVENGIITCRKTNTFGSCSMCYKNISSLEAGLLNNHCHDCYKRHDQIRSFCCKKHDRIHCTDCRKTDDYQQSTCKARMKRILGRLGIEDVVWQS